MIKLLKKVKKKKPKFIFDGNGEKFHRVDGYYIHEDMYNVMTDYVRKYMIPQGYNQLSQFSKPNNPIYVNTQDGGWHQSSEKSHKAIADIYNNALETTIREAKKIF